MNWPIAQVSHNAVIVPIHAIGSLLILALGPAGRGAGSAAQVCEALL